MGRREDRDLIAAARAMAADGLVVGTVGNVSVRQGDRVRITPTRARYAALRRRHLATVDLAGEHVGGGVPSRELPLHLAIYRARPDVHAVIHTHSPHAVAWSFLGEPLAPALEEQAYYGIGEVRTSPPAVAGSTDLARAGVAALGDGSAALLGGHGVVACGATAGEALLVAQVVEHHAQVAWLVRTPAFSTVAPPWNPPMPPRPMPSSPSIWTRRPSG